MYFKFMVLVIFIITGAINIASSLKNNKLAFSFTKPLLMPLLLLVYVVFAKNINIYIVIALTLGFLGDTFLMGRGGILVLGVVSFFFGHLFYLTAFLQNINFSKLELIAYFPIILYGIYLIIICKNVMPGVKRGRLMLLLYMLAISSMSFSSLLRGYFVKGNSFWLSFIGSLLFITSDSLISISKFKQKMTYAGPIIMLTYILAQTLIIAGFI